MDNYVISVIVPVYNVGEYIGRCLDSLVSQTQKCLEIIAVDDGSSDNSGNICDTYSEKYKNVFVIHKENGGLSSARNAGLRSARGEYIGFVDGDDWVEPDMFAVLLKNMADQNADLSCCAMKKDYDEGQSAVKKDASVSLLDRTQLFDVFLREKRIYGYVCNKLFKRALILGDEFDESLLSQEDMDFCMRYAARCGKTAAVFSELYHYRQRAGAMTSEMNYSPRKISVLDVYERALKVYAENCPGDLYIVQRNYLKVAINITGRMKVSKYRDEALKNRLRGIVGSYRPIVLNNENTSFSTKVNIAVSSRFPGLMLRLKQFGKKILRK